MELLDRYLEQVKQSMFMIPDAQKRDIVSELEDSLRSDIEAKESEAGRGLTDGELDAILQRYGHPLLVAGRYRGNQQSVAFGRQLIGPEIFPLYRAILTLNMSLAAIVVLILMVTQPHVTLVGLLTPPLIQFAIVTGIFIAADYSVRRSVTAGGWSARTLPPSQDPYRIPRASSVFEIVALWVFFGIWINPPRDLGWTFGSTWADFRNAFYMPLLALILFMIAFAFVNLFRPHWTRARLGVRIAANALFAAILASKVFVHFGEVRDQFQLIQSHAAMSKMARFEAYANVSITWTLAVATIAVLGQIAYDGWRMARLSPRAGARDLDGWRRENPT